MKPSLQTTRINNRRYLGNKYKLLPFITKVVKENCGDFLSFTDIFAGTGAVASAYTDKRLITNDILFSNYISNTAWFLPENFDVEKLKSFQKIIKRSPQENQIETITKRGCFYANADKFGFISTKLHRRKI